MKVVVQRVLSASVTSEGTLTGVIEKGLLLYVGVGKGDGEKEIRWMGQKIPNLRIFPDENGKMNLSLLDFGGGILAVSQFTLYGDCKKGRRPSFDQAASPDEAEGIYNKLVDYWKNLGIPTETGVFQTDMCVSSENWGPVTFILEV